MTFLLPNGIARIKRLGSGLGIRWYVFYPAGTERNQGEKCLTFRKKAEALAFVKSLQAGDFAKRGVA
jgi:hypothetical protein